MSGDKWRYVVATSGDVSGWIDEWRHIDGFELKFDKSAALRRQGRHVDRNDNL